MTTLKTKEIRKLNPEQRQARLDGLRKDLMNTRSQLAAGGSIDDPRKISNLKRSIARILTIQREEAVKQN